MKKKRTIKLIAIDMDGTLLNAAHEISEKNQQAIRRAVEMGIHVVISTGRPYSGIGAQTLSALGIRYAVTANGGGIYQIPEKKCLFSRAMEPEIVCSVIRQLLKKDIHFDAFIAGERYTQTSCLDVISKLNLSDVSKQYISSSEIVKEDLAAFIEQNHFNVEKLTLNFYKLPDGTFKDREAVISLLAANPQVTYLCGGYSNLEFTKAGTTKELGLRFLADLLNSSMEETMAIGDTENDLAMIKAAGIGVAMQNAFDEVKQAAQFVTLSNEESGVAYAIEKFIF